MNLYRSVGPKIDRESSCNGVSVIIPAHNAERFLIRTLESVSEQEFDGPVQVIVIDDGSADNTLAIAKSYDPGITVIKKHKGGVSSARNAGLQIARHEFIALLDSDDVMRGRRLSLQCEALSLCPGAVLCCTSAELIGENDEVLDQQLSPLNATTLSGVELAQRLFRNNFITTSSVMCRRSAIAQVGGFNEGVTHSEDLDMWLRLSRLGGAVLLPDRLVQYRQHGQQSIADSLAMAKGRFEVRESFIRMFPGEKVRLGRSLVKGELARYALSYGYGLRLRGSRSAERAVYYKALQHAPLHRRLWRYWLGSVLQPARHLVGQSERGQ